MFLKERTSFLAAMLFAVHPIHTEAVSWNTSLTLASDVDIALSCGSFHQYASLYVIPFHVSVCVCVCVCLCVCVCVCVSVCVYRVL